MISRQSIVATGLFLIAGPLAATTIEISPGDNNLVSTMQSLHAGDTLILDGGSYNLSGLFAIDLAGTSSQPIVIRAKAGAQPVINQTNTGQNILDINPSTFITFDGIEFSGGSRGLRFTGGSDITLQNCHVHATQANAISANDTGYDYARFRFIHNEIDHTGDTGEGFYLGCNDAACQFHDSLVANNYIHDLNGVSITQGDGI